MKLKFFKIMTVALILLLLIACQPKQAIKPDNVSQTTEQKVTKFYQGIQYRLAHANSIEPANDGKIHITEFFLYGCPHCYELEPKIQQWLSQQDNVEFTRVPAILGPTWVEMARFYYVAEHLGVLESLHIPFFEEIHNSGKQYYSELAIRGFFIKNGIREADYLMAYNSKEVKEKTNKARILSVQYSLRGVPIIIINNRWKTAPFYVKNQEQMFDVLSYLITLETKAK